MRPYESLLQKFRRERLTEFIARRKTFRRERVRLNREIKNVQTNICLFNADIARLKQDLKKEKG